MLGYEVDEAASMEVIGQEFPGAFVVNNERITERKSIVICGLARGGTSFGASVFARLGIPMTLPEEPELPATFEHRGLRPAFLAKNFDLIHQIAAEFSALYPVWAWKLPAIVSEFERIGEILPNPHFVMIFKEPLSVVARAQALKGGGIMPRVRDVLQRYHQLATVAERTEYPLLMVSYDKAISNMEHFLRVAARFGGVPQFDAATVKARIEYDQRRYLRGWHRERLSQT